MAVNYQAFVKETPMPYPLSDMTVTVFDQELFGDKKGPRMYLIGGCIKDQTCVESIGGKTSSYWCSCPEVTNKCIYYLPQSDTYHECKSMHLARFQHMSTRLGNYLYVAGGRFANESMITTIERFDPVKDTWETVLNDHNMKSTGSLFSSENRYLHLVGGYDPSYNSYNDMTIYDINNVTNIKKGPSMPDITRGDTRVAMLGDEAWVLGGWTSENGFCEPLNLVTAYNLTSKAWRTVDSMSIKRGSMAVASLKGFVFAIGGETREPNTNCSLSDPIFDSERYVSDSWWPEERIPDDRFRFWAGAYENTNNGDFAIYLFGGQTSYNKTTKTFKLLDTTIRYVPEDISENKKLSDGAIAGIVIAAFFFVLFVGCVGFSYMFYKNKHYTKEDLIANPTETDKINTI